MLQKRLLRSRRRPIGLKERITQFHRLARCGKEVLGCVRTRLSIYLQRFPNIHQHFLSVYVLSKSISLYLNCTLNSDALAYYTDRKFFENWGDLFPNVLSLHNSTLNVRGIVSLQRNYVFMKIDQALNPYHHWTNVFNLFLTRTLLQSAGQSYYFVPYNSHYETFNALPYGAMYRAIFSHNNASQKGWKCLKNALWTFIVTFATFLFIGQRFHAVLWTHCTFT